MHSVHALWRHVLHVKTQLCLVDLLLSVDLSLSDYQLSHYNMHLLVHAFHFGPR